MEKKKLLLVAVSVGVVLLIIIGIPLMMIAPRQNQAGSMQTAALSNNAERDWGVAIEANRAQETHLEPAALESPSFVQPNEIYSQREAPQVTTITVPVPQTAAVPSATATQAQRPAAVNLAPSNTQAARPAPAAQARPAAAATPRETAKPAAAQPAAARPAPAPASAPARTYDTYWVQTGAFSTKVRAEGAKDFLSSKGIASIIDNRDIDGKTWYRVRVGPYMSESEANYWLALVKAIEGFGESQVRLTQATR
jgi:DedD protein